MKYLESIDDGVNTFSSFGNDALMPHFVCCVNVAVFAELEELILLAMRNYGIRSALLTMLHMKRWKLITKEKSKAAYEGKLVNDEDWWYYKGSINEDLESFLSSLETEEEIKTEDVLSFFLPKLTENELKLVEEKDIDYMKTFSFGLPDVELEEMNKSDSKDKYLQGQCLRITKLLKIDTLPSEVK